MHSINYLVGCVIQKRLQLTISHSSIISARRSSKSKSGKLQFGSTGRASKSGTGTRSKVWSRFVETFFVKFWWLMWRMLMMMVRLVIFRYIWLRSHIHQINLCWVWYGQLWRNNSIKKVSRKRLHSGPGNLKNSKSKNSSNSLDEHFLQHFRTFNTINHYLLY